MSAIYYHPYNGMDPEERIECAALMKALSDEFGKGLAIVPPDNWPPEDGLLLGRQRKNQWRNQNRLVDQQMRYWEDPGFKNNISRSFMIGDADEACDEVRRLHSEGKDAFLKAAEQKLMVMHVPVGVSPEDALGDWIWSFIDRPESLMVQEAVPMHYERRFIVMNGKVVTHSPVATHLTPMSRGDFLQSHDMSVEHFHYLTPGSENATYQPGVAKRMKAFAEKVAAESELQHICIDLCILGDDLNGPIEVIEFNPMQPGHVGLYGCDPRAIARAVREALSPELHAIVEQRRLGELPAIEIEPEAPKVEKRINPKHSIIREIAEQAKAGLDLDEDWQDDGPD